MVRLESFGPYYVLVTTVIFVVNLPDIVKISLFFMLSKNSEDLLVMCDFVIKFV